MRKIALKRSIKKIAHHLKFEENWSRKILGISESKGWIWCTMYTAHVLDERKKFVGLKFQSFLYFQAEAYEEELKKYLVPKIPGGNSLNTVDNAPVQDLLYYNGLDTYYTFLLFLEQRKQIQETPSLYSINKLFLDGALCFADMESTGFGVVPGYYDKATKEIEKDIRKTEKEILKTKECLRFKKKLKREFQFSNDKDIYTMIYDVMKTEKTKETKGGKGSTDAEVLMGLSKKGSEWAKHIFTPHKTLHS
jgi:DNA polymerase I-like protein with 3'-5' exonuclease and polymerase domains